MQDKKKTSFFKKIFGQKSSCCSLEIEEVDSNDSQVPAQKNDATNCCRCSPTKQVAQESQADND